jgi:prepilin-type N-terminal cleavage/methylation domain-containing protein
MRYRQPITQPHARRRQAGFTITELLIATVVFSTVLVVVMAGVIYFSNTYYRGVTQTKTQNAARKAMDSIAQSIQFGGTAFDKMPNKFCVGQKRFTYVTDRKIVRTITNAADQNYHAFVVDTPSDCVGTNLNINTPTLASATNPQELLGENMRLAYIAVNDVGPRLYEIKIVVAYGDIDLLQGSGESIQCRGGTGSQFCAVSALTTTVQQRVAS